MTQRESLMSCFFPPVVMEKPTFYSDLSHQVWCHTFTGCSMVRIGKPKTKPGPGSNWSLLWSMQQSEASSPRRTVAHRSPLPLENSRTPRVWFLCHHIPFSVSKTKPLPMLNPHFLSMERSINSQDIPWAKALIKISKWRLLPSAQTERGIYGFCAGEPA